MGRAPLRLLRAGATWQDFADAEIADVVPPGGDTVLSVLDLIDCLESGAEPRLSARKALQATELIFATYESESSPWPSVAPPRRGGLGPDYHAGSGTDRV